MNKYLLWILFSFLYSLSGYSQSCDNCSSTSVINSGLIACYPFNGNANDESGNGNDGTSSGATLTTDRFGVTDKAYHFDGASYISIPNSSSLKSPDTSITVAVWFNVESWFVYGGVNYASLLCKSHSTSNTQYRVTINDNALDLILNGKQCIVPLSSTIQLNQWYQVVAVGKTDSVTFYLNGSKVNTSAYTGTFPSDTTSVLEIGRDYAGAIDYFTGKLDDIRIYNRALSDDEVRQVYAVTPTPPTGVSAGNDETIAKGSSVQLQGTDSGGVTYSWTPGNSLSDSTLQNPMASPDTTTQYILTVMNGSCSAKDTVLITVIPATAPCDNCSSNISINNGLVACYPFNGNTSDESGNNNHGTNYGATLTTDRFGQSNRAYYFDGSSYISVPNSTSLQSPSIAVSMSFWFNVTNWFTDGTYNYAPVLCKSNANNSVQYRIDAGSNSLDVIFGGQRASLSLSTSFQLNQWYHIVAVAQSSDVAFYINGESVGSVSYTGTFPNNTSMPLEIGRDVPGATEYIDGKIDDIRIYNRLLSAEEAKQLYKLQPTPPIVSAGSDQTITKGSSIQLQETDTGGVTYSWNPADGLDDSTLRQPTASPDTTTQYILTVTNGSCSVRDTVVVTVVAPAFSCDNCASPIPLNNGLVACYPFNGNAADETGNGYDGTNSTATLTTDRFGKANKAYSFNGTSEYIDITQNFPDLTSSTVSVWIKSDGNVGQNSILFEGISDCGNDFFIFYQNGALFFGADKGGAQMDGTPGAGVVSVNMLNTWTHVAWTMTPTQSLIYINGNLTATFNKTGSVVGYHHAPTIGSFFDGDGPPCGSPRGRYFHGSIDDFRLYNRDLSAAEVMQLYQLNPDSPVVNAGSDKSICFGDSVQLKASGATTYLWMPGTALSDSTIENPYSKPADTITYIVTGTNGACSSYDTISVNVSGPVNADAGTAQDICQGDSVQLNGTATGVFVWTPSTGLSNDSILNPYAKPANSTQYYLTASSGNCQKQDSVMVNVISGLNISAGGDEKICTGDSVQLHATGGNTYLWTPATGMNDTSIADPMVSPPATIDYIVRSGVSGCFYYDTVEVEVKLKPTIDAGGDIDNCVGNTEVIQATSSGATDFLWTPSTNLNDPTLSNPTVTFTNTSVKYIVKASNSITGCFSEDSLLVEPDSVHADFTSDKNRGLAPLTVNFTNHSYNATQSSWFFDSTYSNPLIQTDAQHTFTSSGTYTVKLIVSNSNGCSDTASEDIVVLANQSVFIPNVFTPNGDDVNEVFKIVYNETLTKGVRGSIWNRWGGRMYEFTMPGGQWWDGKEEGVDVPAGVYFYFVYVDDIFGATKAFKGTVTLLR